MKLKRTIVAPALVAGVALVSGGWLLQQGVGREDSVFQRARVFDEVMHYVSTRYVDEHPTSELYQKALEGMLKELGDPHTVFMSADEYAQLHLQTSGEYGGVGIQIAPRDGWITAVSVLPGTPAERAGIRVGDRFIMIDGKSTEGWTDDQAVKALRGPKGTPVQIRMLRVGVDEPIEFRIVRDEIHVQSVPYAYMAAPGIGYLNLVVFAETSTDEIRAAIAKLRQQGATKLVLDLRGNPGGLLDQGVSVSDLFLPAGKSIVETRARDPRQTETYAATTEEQYAGVPVVVLVDDYSASAAEIVAGALQDHDRALVVGSTSYGKGSVQSLFPLSGGNFLKMTTGKWYTPVGRSIQKDHAPADEARSAARTDTTMDENGEPIVRDTTPRKPYRTDAGRVVYGGGGIVPDVVVKEDTATALEKEFFQVYAKHAAAVNSVIMRYAVEYERGQPNLRPDFAVTPEMRQALFQRLVAAGVPFTRPVWEGAERYVTQRLVNEIALSRFGQSVAAQRNDPTDRALQEAIRLLRGSSDQASLFRAAQGSQSAQAASRR